MGPTRGNKWQGDIRDQSLKVALLLPVRDWVSTHF
jgi:hypothetical protein